MTTVSVGALVLSIGLLVQPGGDRTWTRAVFEGRTPCGAIANAFTGFPAQECEKIKWRLTLYRKNGEPSTYLFEGTRAKHEGRWRMTTQPNGRVIYQLAYEPARTLSLLSVDDQVLLLLQDDLTVLRGDASYSYVLNRVERRP